MKYIFGISFLFSYAISDLYCMNNESSIMHFGVALATPLTFEVLKASNNNVEKTIMQLHGLMLANKQCLNDILTGLSCALLQARTLHTMHYCSEQCILKTSSRDDILKLLAYMTGTQGLFDDEQIKDFKPCCRIMTIIKKKKFEQICAWYDKGYDVVTCKEHLLYLMNWYISLPDNKKKEVYQTLLNIFTQKTASLPDFNNDILEQYAQVMIKENAALKTPITRQETFDFFLEYIKRLQGNRRMKRL